MGKGEIMNGSGNHMVDGADKELDKQGKCVCGSDNWETIDWCSGADEECKGPCEYSAHPPCCDLRQCREKCKNCGHIE